MMKMRAVIGLVGALAMAAGAAAPQFETVPAAANRALKAVKGKPIRKGLVFVNGHYVKPPYVLMRSGTALFNHSTQITGQVIPWKAFLATQGGGGASAPRPTAPAPAPAPARSAVPSVDDLFADDPPTPTPAAPPPPVAAAPVVEEPAEDAPFTPNDASRRLLKRINDQRSYLDRSLREGYMVFFGARYAPVTVTPRLARELMSILPEAIRDSDDGAELFGRLRGKGITYLNREICDELIDNRPDYTQLIARRAEMVKEEEVNRLLEGVH